jgi:hypothetical protein
MMIVFGLLRISMPPKEIIALTVGQFLALLIIYPWVKPRDLTLGRLILYALVVSSISAALLGIARWIAVR